MENFESAFYSQNSLPEQKVYEIEYSGIFRRWVALFLDNLITGTVGGVIGMLLGGALGIGMVNQIMASGFVPDPNNPTLPPELMSQITDVQFFVTIGGLILSWLYFAGFESSAMQGTPGKKIMGIIVTDTDGDRITFGMATGRFLGKGISAIILGIGYLIAFFTPKKQALHDFIAGTIVIRQPPKQY